MKLIPFETAPEKSGARHWLLATALLAVVLWAPACSRQTSGRGGEFPPPRNLVSERRLQYLVASPAVVIAQPGADPAAGTSAPDERLQKWVRKYMTGLGFTVVDDPGGAFDVEVRLAEQARDMGRLVRERAAIQLVAGGRVLAQWETDEHIEPPRRLAPTLARELIEKVINSPRVAEYADALYGRRTRPLRETVGRRSYVFDEGGAPPLEAQIDETRAIPYERSAMGIAILSPTPAPSADALAAASLHAERGTALRERGQLRDAYAEFEEAFVLHDDPAYIYELGDAAQKLGDRDDALGFYRDYLRRAPQGPRASDAANLIRDLGAAPAK